jgi:molybdopterin converting factor small subunit
MTKADRQEMEKLKSLGEEKMFERIFARIRELMESEKLALRERTEATDALWELRAKVAGEKRDVETQVEDLRDRLKDSYAAKEERLFESIAHAPTCHSGGDPLLTCTCGVGNIS